jgi:hypothetical protein
LGPDYGKKSGTECGLQISITKSSHVFKNF